MSKVKKKSKVLAVSSGGGHWIQLLRLRPAFENCSCTYVSVQSDYRDAVVPDEFYLVPEANRETKFALLIATLKILFIILRVRPDAIISTGAAHGYIAIRLGKLIGAKTMFIDSIANAAKLSMSGELAVNHADVMLTQWPELSDDMRIQYRGSVL
jgi:UDP-N-acetylglucosamine:LPS N-acetylglucosamine transferase